MSHVEDDPQCCLAPMTYSAALEKPKSADEFY